MYLINWDIFSVSGLKSPDSFLRHITGLQFVRVGKRLNFYAVDIQLGLVFERTMFFCPVLLDLRTSFLIFKPKNSPFPTRDHRIYCSCFLFRPAFY